MDWKTVSDKIVQDDQNKWDRKALAEELEVTEVAPRLPRFRKPWMSEDYRMSIFDAVALGLTFFYFEK